MPTRPVLGTTCNLRIRRGPVGLPATIAFDASWPSPFVVAPSCIAHLDPANFASWIWFPLGNVPTNGQLAVGLAVPNDPAVVGLPLTLQAVFTGSTSALGFDMTNGVFAQFGS
ncbi:MAG: hypothetical protein CMJ83_15355 [Planctomycetes bacterium]|nr:hypothetical protein [Planctomycetota bacterium]